MHFKQLNLGNVLQKTNMPCYRREDCAMPL